MALATPTLYDILLMVYDELGELRYGVATGGTATTLVDSGLTALYGTDDDLNQGTIFLVEADSAAPEGEYAEITDYATSSGTVTFSSSGIDGISSAPASADEYAIASSDYPLDTMRGIVNRALVRMGDIPSTDESLTTAATQKEYTIPAAATKALRRVYLAQESTANNEGWVEVFNWKQELNILLFPNQPPTGKTIKLFYMGVHTRLATASATLSNYVPVNRVVAEAFYLATISRIRRAGGASPDLNRQIADARSDLDIFRRRFPIRDGGTPFKPILSGSKSRNRRRRGAYGPWIQS